MTLPTNAPSLSMQRQAIEHLIAMSKLDDDDPVIVAARYACDRTIKFLERNPDYARAMWVTYRHTPDIANIIEAFRGVTMTMRERGPDIAITPDLETAESVESEA